jgi:hypothetical protein
MRCAARRVRACQREPLRARSRAKAQPPQTTLACASRRQVHQLLSSAKKKKKQERKTRLRNIHAGFEAEMAGNERG